MSPAPGPAPGDPPGDIEPIALMAPDMTHPTAATLVALGAKRLAAALLELAGQSDEAARLVERLTAAPDAAS